MAARGRPGPFRPGAGGLPPYLAGREREQALFRRRLAGLRERAAPPNEIILYGPRGNGKTALLVWVEQEAAASSGVEVICRTPASLDSGARLAHRLLPESWWRRLSPAEVRITGISWRPGDQHAPDVEEALAARARTRPVILLLDEAHTLDPEAGRLLLQASRRVGRKLPFQLVLAGTPNLENHLASMGASFWNRARQMPVDRLDAEAAAAAIRRPLEQEGMSISDDALAHIVAESHGYPYFLQLWGDAAWEQAEETAGSITRVETDAAAPDFASVRGNYYRQRFNELEKAGLLGAARAVADAFAQQPLLYGEEIRRAVRQALETPAAEDPPAPEAALRTFRHLGLIWQSGADPRWEPGIPSLMDYLREHTPAR